ncbi:MAG: hypothetical protein J7M24_01250, partial [Candidatus Latescibacteria bacterium]|nr:hypothetical protein [Candidatus Latescibacterota bacterium]
MQNRATEMKTGDVFSITVYLSSGTVGGRNGNSRPSSPSVSRLPKGQSWNASIISIDCAVSAPYRPAVSAGKGFFIHSLRPPSSNAIRSSALSGTSPRVPKVNGSHSRMAAVHLRHPRGGSR